MSVTFAPIDVGGADRGAFTRFLTRDRFPFHVVAEPSEAEVAEQIDSGHFEKGVRALWVDEHEHGRIGVAVLENPGGPSPAFDLRLAGRYRGRGLGTPIVTALTAFVFETFPDAVRLEGQTREDNLAMRTVLQRSGFVKEAHRRDLWPVDGAAPLAAVAYAILRRDWVSGTTTTFVWEDTQPGRSDVTGPAPVA